MKKRIIFVFTAAMLFFSPVMLSSCGDEEENEPVQNNSGKNNGTNNNQQTVKEESKYTVSYSSDFGVAPQNFTVKEGDKLTSGDLKPLDTDGYIFLGWYNGSNQVAEGFEVKQDLKLVAKWTKDGVVYANELKDFLAKKTDDSKVYDITISDLNPDMDVVVKALKDNPKIKVNLNLENCTELKDVKIMPDGGISKSKVESFLVNLVSLTLPNGVVNIVLGCYGLTSINIPNSVTTIEIYTETPPAIRNANAINPDCKIFVEKECVDAFKNAEGWKNVAIQIKTIGGNYLYASELNDFLAKQTDESKVYDVIILDLKPDMEVIVKALIDNPKVKINLDLEGCTDLKEIDFYEKEPENHATTTTDTDFEHPNNVGDGEYHSKETTSKRLEDNGRLNNLSSISFPKYITTIALYGDGLISLDIPNSVKHLHLECNRLTTLNIPNSINKLSLYCDGLTSLNIPNSVNVLALGCNRLTSLDIPNSVSHLSLYSNGLTSLIIPNSVSEVDYLSIEALTTLIINNPNLLPIDSHIDLNSNCTIYVPVSAVVKYKNAVNWSEYANQIKAIDDEGIISLHVSELEDYLSNVTDDSKIYNIKILDKTLNDFDNDSHSIDFIISKFAQIKVNLDLSECTQLKQIGPNLLSEQILSNNWNLISLNVPDGVTHLVLQNYVGLTIFNIPKSVKTLGVGGCDGLTSLEIPNSVTDFQFESCAGITSLTIPNNVKRIYLDDSDNRLNSIYLSDIPPTIDNWSTINPNCTLYVPQSAVETYKNADGWSKFDSQIKGVFFDPQDDAK